MLERIRNMVMFLAVVAGLAASAASDDYFASVETAGPDCYRDGSVVADGEVYALVFTKRGSVFAGFQADGALVDPEASEIVMLLPTAKGGRCEQTLVVVSKTYYTKHKTGVWELYLLDTRDAGGRPAGLDAAGNLRRVNAYETTSLQVGFGQGCFAAQGAGGKGLRFPIVASELSAIPPSATAPVITRIEAADGTVTLGVASTHPYFTYDVIGAETLDEAMAPVGLEKKDGTRGGEMPMEADGAKAKFFRVIVER